MGVTRQPVRALLWLLAGVVGYIAIEGILTSRLNDLLPAGGWRELDVPPAMFFPIEIAALLVACAALAGLAAAASALLLWRGYALSRDLPAKFSRLGARLLIASWPFETAFLFLRGNHVPGSPSGGATALVAAGLLALEGVVLWRVTLAARTTADVSEGA